MTPERGFFLGPESEQAMVGGNSLESVPEQWAQLIGQREIGKRFTMNAAVTLCDLKADGTEHFAIKRFSDLEFRDPASEFIGWKTHRLPEGGQLAYIVKRGAPDAVIGRCHYRQCKNSEAEFKAERRFPRLP